jgi:8-amino-7-oxononanoate synthase
LEKYGSGCTGSRFLNGTLDIHEALEEALADFMGREAALVFSTGYQTNVGTISALLSRGDRVIVDKADHASIVDGCLLCMAEMKRFKHNDMADLSHVLEQNDHAGGTLIVVDGVFSMEGDIACLPELMPLARTHDCRVMVDDAHSIGVLGTGGRGTEEHFGLDGQVDLIMGTFSKSFASIGGFIAADDDVIGYIKHHSRALIFSASIPPASVAAVQATLEIIRTEPERRERLWENTRTIRTGLQHMGYDTGTSQTPIIPIVIGDRMKTFAMWKALFEAGLFVNPAIPPAVPPGRALLRTSYMATHTSDQLHRMLDIYETVGREMGVLG